MRDTFTSLYPSGVEALPVIPRFPVPRVQHPPVRELNRGGVLAYYNTRIVAEIQVHGTTETVAVIDKAFPHSRFDIMLLVSNDEVRSSCADLHESTSRVIWTMASEFRDYTRKLEIKARFKLAGSEIHQAFNYSRDTVDRENGQYYDKRFHLHLNCWPESDLDGLAPVPLGAVQDAAVRRSMLDPLTYLGPRIMRDLLRARVEGFEVLPVDVDVEISRRLPPGLKVRLDGWHSLREVRYLRLLQQLHRTASTVYRVLFRAMTGKVHAPRAWHRESLLAPSAIMENIGRIAFLGDETRQLVYQLALCLRNVSERDMEMFQSDKSLASRYLALAGLDYSIGLCSSTGGRSSPGDTEPYVVMQFRLLGDVGSASLPPLRKACMALLDRRDGPILSAAELDDRREFISGFLEEALPKLEASGLATRMLPNGAAHDV